jgi:hypothetical protein
MSGETFENDRIDVMAEIRERRHKSDGQVLVELDLHRLT